MPTVTRLTSNGVFQSLGGFDEVSLNSGSIRFNGSTNYLSVPSSDAFAFGTGDYTMECWVYPQNTGSDFFSGTSDLCNFGYTGGQFFFYTGTINNFGALVLNQWNHIAASRVSGTLNCYLNGVRGFTGSQATNFSNQSIVIGINQSGSGGSLLGFLSNIRIVKGTALYTANFTPPTAPLLPVSNTSLLLSTNSQNPFKDSSVNNFAITKVSNPTFNTLGPFYFPANTSINLANTNNNPVLGSNTNIITSTTSNGVVMISNGFDEVSMSSGSILFNGINTTYLAPPVSSSFLLTTDFTIEVFVYIPNGTTQTVYADIYSGTVSNNPGLFTNFAGSNNFHFYSGIPAPTVSIDTGIKANDGAWHHMAVVRNGSTITVYIDGVSRGTATNSSTINFGSTTAGRIGAGSNGLTDNPFLGYISNLRVVNGTALYTANFTPPKMPLSSVANTSLLLNTFAAEPFVDNSPNNFTITRVGTPLANTLSPFANTQQKVLNTGTMMVKQYDEITFNLGTVGSGPVISAYANTASGTTSTTQVVNLPTGISAGNLIIIAFRPNGTLASAPTNPNFTLMYWGDTRTAFYYRIADGTEGSTTTFTLPSAQPCSSVAYRITNWYGNSSGIAWSGSQITGTATTTAAAPNLNNTFESLSPTLWITASGIRNTSGALFNSFPTNYTQSILRQQGQTQGEVAMVAKPNLGYVNPEIPGNFTTTQGTNFSLITIAIRGVL